MATGRQILATATEYTGLPYVMGAEADLTGHDWPEALDCSELVQLACTRNGVSLLDGHWLQWKWCAAQGTLISVEQAIATPGALLFVYDGTTNGHVAFSQGDGTTMEARGTRWGCGSWPVEGRGWTHGALIPDVDYEEDDMAMTDADMDKLAAKIATAVAAALDARERTVHSWRDGHDYPKATARELEQWSFEEQQMATLALQGAPAKLTP
jgi:hypothetical protein